MNTLIKNITIVNEGRRIQGDVWIRGDRFESIGSPVSSVPGNPVEINGEGLWLLPGVIDDQVHFREPGATHKADLATESRAAVAGGVTSFMEMPNTTPQTLNQERLREKYALAAGRTAANHAFYLGASNDNAENILAVDPSTVCGLKIFMGSSTGNMLVDREEVLNRLFSQWEGLIATHCEDEQTVRQNLQKAKEKYGEDIPFSEHPIIRDVEACWKSSSLAVSLARKHGTRLHVLHLTTAKELELFEPTRDWSRKHITAEACVHHLWFSSDDYARLGSRIKCNPAIKAAENREAIWQALLEDRIDVIATDHAPHTAEEKARSYESAPAGLPLIQHSLPLMLECVAQGRMTLENLVWKMCHAPAELFRVKDRGYLREGAYADCVIVDPQSKTEVTAESLHYKCGWSPLEGTSLRGQVIRTFVNGHSTFEAGRFSGPCAGRPLEFHRLA